MFLVIILMSFAIPINGFCQNPPATDPEALGPPAELEKADEFICAFSCPLVLPAEFIGGRNRWKAYLTKHLRYPDKAVDAKIQGSIKVIMVVGKNGRVEEAKALNGLGGGLETEALRVVLNSPRWKPAEQNGFKISYRFIQTITFQLDDDAKKKHQKKAIAIHRTHDRSTKKRNLMNQGRSIKKSVSDTLSTDYDFVISNPSVAPRFPGGPDSFNRYINQHAIFPHQKAEGCKSIEINIRFLITKHGDVANVDVLNDVGAVFAADAVRLLMSSPKWKPAETGGLKVSYRMVEKLHFSISYISNDIIGRIKDSQPCDAELPGGYW